MHAVGLVVSVLAVASADTVPPYLAFPEPGLDDLAADEGYTTRVYSDAAPNAFHVYLRRGNGRVDNVWADAVNESVGFTARDSSGQPAVLGWGSSGAVVMAAGGARSVAYALETPATVSLGLFLLGSMRVERDFQYAARDSVALSAEAFPQRELLDLIDNLERLSPVERRRELALLGVGAVADLRDRLQPRVPPRSGDTTWVVNTSRPSFDGRHHLSLTLQGDSRKSAMTLAGRVVTIRPLVAGPLRFDVRVTTDAPALTPLARSEIFNSAFARFFEEAHADTAHPERFRRLEREVRGVELLCYREKFMAGLPTYATYFGRDGMMTALMMTPVWRPAMREHVIASVLGKLCPDGDASHEEALGGQAIRENAGRYNQLLDEVRRRSAAGDEAGATRALARARNVIDHLQMVRENHRMVDDDFQLPVLAGGYLSDSTVSLEAKHRFLLAPAAGPGSPSRLVALVRNLNLVAQRTAAYAKAPQAVNLVSFPGSESGGWSSASWRDSRVGYAGGRFAMDVNVVWAPLALRGMAHILDLLDHLGFSPESLEARVPEMKDSTLADYARHRAALPAAIATWSGAQRHFEVVLSPETARRRAAARISTLPAVERDYWDSLLARTPLNDSLRFLALSLDEQGRPIPVVSTDPGMLVLLRDPPLR